MKTYTFKELSGLSRENYRKNGYVAYIIFFFSILIVCSVIAINLVLPLFFYILVPLIIVPAFFAGQAAIILLRDAPQLTLGGFFKCFFGYYGEHFRSTFRVLKSFLFSLIFYGAILFTSVVVAFSTFYATNFCNFADLVNSIKIFDLANADELSALIDKYYFAINMFAICTTFPAISVFSFVFIYLCSKNSVSLTLRLNNYKLTGAFIAQVHTAVMKKHKKTFLKYYWSLNWPLYVFLLGGFALGCYVGYLYEFSYISLYTFGMIIGLFFAYFFFGPTYLANKEAIQMAMQEAYDEESQILMTTVASSMEDLLTKLHKLEEEKLNKEKDDNDSESDS